MGKEDEMNSPEKGNSESKKRQNRPGNDYNKNEKFKKQKKHEFMDCKFKGGYEEMKGNVFECPEEGKVTLQYTNTTKELIRYVNKTFKYADDMEFIIVRNLRKLGME